MFKIIKKKALHLAVLFCLSIFCQTTVAALEKSEVETLFKEANSAFHQASALTKQNQQEAKKLYQKSAMRLERIIKETGIKNGKLYYNLGNAYFRLGKTGLAILNYRRALIYMPADVNINQNLKFARSKCIDSIAEKPRTAVLKTLLFWHYDLSGQVKSIILAASIFALCLGASLRIFRNNLISRQLLLVPTILFISFLASMLVEYVVTVSSHPGVITASEVTARKGNGESYQPAFTEKLHSGTEFNLLEKRQNWLQVELNDSRLCWLPAQTAKLVKE